MGYHGCHARYGEELLLGKTPVAEWKKSQNDFDWLGEGVYFWEHSLERAWQWAASQYGGDGFVIGALIQLGACFDLMDARCTLLLAQSYSEFVEALQARKKKLPTNGGVKKKARKLDCAVINRCLDRMIAKDVSFDTVRGAFL
ncbi:MAG TPA: hypothetical protein VMF30_04630 [Pirellulales bacterium]|nr:hypothetical protein [Pirellulales bacterium]